jgi:methanogenic corrinoid protein MtbC1
MPDAGWKDRLVAQMTELQIGIVLQQVRESLELGEDPLVVVEMCQEGLRHVGELYERGEYFLAALIMAGEIFRQAMDLIVPHLTVATPGRDCRVLLGTVQGDIHDMGKNLLGALLRCHGFSVQDLGVDVAPAEFLRQVEAAQPDVVGISGLLTTSYAPMREAVVLIRNSLPPERQPKGIIIGGAAVNEQARQLVGADYCATDAMHGVRLCQQIMASAGCLAVPVSPTLR